MPIPLLAAVGMGASAAGGLGKSILGITQLIKGRRMKPKRPEYNIPDEILENKGLRQANLNARMAGAAQAEQNIQQSGAQYMQNVRQAGTSSSSVLANAGLAQATANRALQGLQAQEAQDYQRRASELERTNRIVSQFRDKAFQLNEMEPYLDEARTKAALTQGGLKNVFSGMEDISATAGKMSLAQSLGLFGQGGGAIGNIGAAGMGVNTALPGLMSLGQGASSGYPSLYHSLFYD